MNPLLHTAEMYVFKYSLEELLLKRGYSYSCHADIWRCNASATPWCLTIRGIAHVGPRDGESCCVDVLFGCGSFELITCDELNKSEFNQFQNSNTRVWIPWVRSLCEVRIVGRMVGSVRISSFRSETSFVDRAYNSGIWRDDRYSSELGFGI